MPQWAATTRVTRSARQPLWLSQKLLAVVLVVSLVVVGLGVASLIRSAVRTFGGATVSTPGTLRVDLDEGRYTLFERVGSKTQVGPVTASRTDRPRVGAESVSVTGPDGEPVSVARRSVSETLTLNDTIYVGVAGFTAERSGGYVVVVGGEPTVVRLGRTLSDGTSSALVLTAVGIVLGGVSGTALLVIVFVKSSRRRNPVL